MKWDEMSKIKRGGEKRRGEGRGEEDRVDKSGDTRREEKCMIKLN